MKTLAKETVKEKSGPVQKVTNRHCPPIRIPTVSTGYHSRAGTFGDPDGNVIEDFFDIGDCRELVAYALCYPNISMAEDNFLDAIFNRLEEYGEDGGYCSARQAKWLAELGWRGAKYHHEGVL